ncbi:MAG: hypothetical protein ACK4YP_28180 [Myxococcota bacterium]
MTAWNVLPHGPLTQLAPRVWQVTGTLPNLPLPRNMTLWRMDDGRLWVHSAIACDDATMGQIAALGTPAVLVVPSDIHRLDAAAWKQRHPDVRVVCPAASRGKVTDVVPVDGPDTDAPGVVTHAPPGLSEAEHVYEIDVGAGRALVFCDAVQNMRHLPGLAGLFFQLVGSTGFFGVTRIGRWRLVTDAKALAAWLDAAADTPDLALLCLSHGDPVLADPRVKLRAAAARL